MQMKEYATPIIVIALVLSLCGCNSVTDTAISTPTAMDYLTKLIDELDIDAASKVSEHLNFGNEYLKQAKLNTS
jgi:Sec-independent protein secretion pathway component TatC